MRYAVLALLLFAAGVALSRMEREAQSFHPLVRVRTADGLFLTFVHQPSPTASQCRQVVSTFSGSLAGTCSTCYVESSGCPTALDGLDRALAADEPLRIHTVDGGAFRVSLVGPPHAVEAECLAMAGELNRRGLSGAACRPPAPLPRGR